MDRSKIRFWDQTEGKGQLLNGLLIIRYFFRVFQDGDFRPYCDDEVKPIPQKGEDIIYIYDRDGSRRTFLWALDKVPEKKKPNPNAGAVLEESIILKFLSGRGFGFIESPSGDEDLHIHINEMGRHVDGAILPGYSGVPREGVKVVFIRNERGRVQSWAIKTD